MQWCMKQTVEKDSYFNLQGLFLFCFSKFVGKSVSFSGLCAVVPVSRCHFLYQSQLKPIVARFSPSTERKKVPFYGFN